MAFLRAFVIHRSSMMKSSASSSSLASLSGHSADGDAAAGDGNSDSEQDRIAAVAASVNAGAEAPRPYNSRPDVGSIGILSGNWGATEAQYPCSNI